MSLRHVLAIALAAIPSSALAEDYVGQSQIDAYIDPALVASKPEPTVAYYATRGSPVAQFSRDELLALIKPCEVSIVLPNWKKLETRPTATIVWQGCQRGENGIMSVRFWVVGPELARIEVFEFSDEQIPLSPPIRKGQ